MTLDASPIELQVGRPSEPELESALYLRYVTVLALLCECAPYVDELDYLERIGDVLKEASENYPLEWRRNGDSFEVGPRGTVD